MIPRLEGQIDTMLAQPGFFGRLVEAGFSGEIELGDGSRAAYATDNSIYQLFPGGIVFPRSAADLAILARVLDEPEFRQVTIALRGGGTGTNGQALSRGVVVDCSRHMTRILEIDPERRRVRVEAGVVKDQLNRALKPYGLFFAPELSTSNRATIGGMINTDACGQGSCLYGKTSNHVLGLRAILAGGKDWWFRPADAEALHALKKRPDKVGEIYRTLDRIEKEQREKIAAVFPPLNRYMTGYDLAHLRAPDGGLNVNSVLCGAEGTLAMIAEAELNVLPLPGFAALINIRYDDFNTALEDARNLAALKVASVETVDEKVLGLAKGDIIWAEIAPFFPDDPDVRADGINIVEVLADSGEELADKIEAVVTGLAARPMSGRLGHTVAAGHAQVEAIWTMRKRAVGLLGSVEGPVRPVAFVEDTAVPPENLAPYIREFRQLLDGEGLDYGMFGHVDAGVLHVRPALDLTRPEHVALVKRISDGVVALTRKYGGVLWGEHGKGVRSEYVPDYFGDLYPSLQHIKRLFDPHHQLNPGKIAAPSADELMKIDAVPLRGDFDRAIGNDIRAAFDNAAYCNGNGACFDFDEKSPMCPSYKGTRDRRFSPKGRASLMREWLRLLARRDIDPRREAARQREAFGLLRWPSRLWNSLSPANRADFSHEVRHAMDTCLACKACAGQCPVKVSVPVFRSKFLELYHGRYLRPLKDPLIAGIETTLPLMARLRPFYNFAVRSKPGKWVMRQMGLTALPVMPALDLSAELKRCGVAVATVAALKQFLPSAVVFVPDAFTAHFNPQLVLDAVELARALGFTPFVAPPHVNGKALHVHGYLGAFEKAAAATTHSLRALAQTGATLVGIDPSMTLAFRSEYAKAVPQARDLHVLLPQEWLAQHLDRIAPASAPYGRFKLLLHCTERTNAPAAQGQWAEIFARLGISLQQPPLGCCGMAGTFGHEVRNRALSDTIYGLSWSQEIEATTPGEIVMVTGYSCRSQVKLLDDAELPHPLQILLRLLSAEMKTVRGKVA